MACGDHLLIKASFHATGGHVLRGKVYGLPVGWWCAADGLNASSVALQARLRAPQWSVRVVGAYRAG